MPTQEERLAALEAGITQAEAREHVRLLLAQYSLALDARDAVAMESLFSRDAELVVIPWGIAIRGRQAVMEFFRAYFTSDWRDPRHYGANEAVVPQEGGFGAFSYFHEVLSRGAQSVIGWGTWEDKVILEDGSWKFASRTITVLALVPIDKGWAQGEKVMPL